MLALHHYKTGNMDSPIYSLDPCEAEETGFEGVINKARRYWIWAAREVYGPQASASTIEKAAFETEWVRYRDLIEQGDITNTDEIDSVVLTDLCANDPTSIVYALKVVNDLTMHLKELQNKAASDIPERLAKLCPNKGIPSRGSYKGLCAIAGMRGPGV